MWAVGVVLNPTQFRDRRHRMHRRGLIRISGIHRDTIMRLLRVACGKCEAILGKHLRAVPVKDGLPAAAGDGGITRLYRRRYREAIRPPLGLIGA